MDNSVTVAVLALCGTVITVAGGVVIALVTSNKESASSAESALEKSLRERIAFKEDVIADLREAAQSSDERYQRLEDAYRLLSEELANHKQKMLDEGNQ